MMPLNLPPLNLIWISWPVFCNRMFSQYCGRTANSRTQVSCTLFPALYHSDSKHLENVLFCLSGKMQENRKAKMGLRTGLRWIVLRKNSAPRRLSLERRTCSSSVLQHALDSFSSATMRCLQKNPMLTVNEIIWPHSWCQSVYVSTGMSAALCKRSILEKTLSNF